MLSSKSILITGASSGIGRAIALIVGGTFGRVYLSGRSGARLEEVASRLPRDVGCVLVGDLTQARELERIAEQIPSLDALVHSAGLFGAGPLRDLPTKTRDAILDLNLKVPYDLTRALLDKLIRARGDVVFVGSTIVRFPHAEMSAYAMSKHALIGLADSLRMELSPRGVRISSVFPGRTATPMQEEVVAHQGGSYRASDHLSPESVARAVESVLTLPPDAEITDLFIRPRWKTS